MQDSILIYIIRGHKPIKEEGMDKIVTKAKANTQTLPRKQGVDNFTNNMHKRHKNQALSYF